MKYTHRAWLNLCPVYISDPDADVPTVTARNYVPNLWLWFNIKMEQAAAMLTLSLGGEYELKFSHVSKLEQPIEID